MKNTKYSNKNLRTYLIVCVQTGHVLQTYGNSDGFGVIDRITQYAQEFKEVVRSNDPAIRHPCRIMARERPPGTGGVRQTRKSSSLGARRPKTIPHSLLRPRGDRHILKGHRTGRHRIREDNAIRVRRETCGDNLHIFNSNCPGTITLNHKRLWGI